MHLTQHSFNAADLCRIAIGNRSVALNQWIFCLPWIQWILSLLLWGIRVERFFKILFIELVIIYIYIYIYFFFGICISIIFDIIFLIFIFRFQLVATYWRRYLQILCVFLFRYVNGYPVKSSWAIKLRQMTQIESPGCCAEQNPRRYKRLKTTTTQKIVSTQKKKKLVGYFTALKSKSNHLGKTYTCCILGTKAAVKTKDSLNVIIVLRKRSKVVRVKTNQL